ncbi:hypothetical protein LUZ62_035131 [Rhynchospora pubera]|uniref:DUF4220 domain-containing protein n=1 Tax=Rhynchospora pubera TaxID=906938 RepID=A0AAV8EWN1_9POAL|nr:hypothetical protein LUZ62_035131 [Rhynchospora pubera]
MFILRAYNCFSVFKSHIFGTVINPSLALHHLGIRSEDRNFKFIGIELSFLYDILYTKATVLHHVAFPFIRIGSFVTVVIALLFFHVNVKGENVTSDIIITYVLLSFALFLEIYSALHLAASNWMVISLLRQNKKWSRNLAGWISRAKNCIPCYGKQSIRMGQCSLIQIAIERNQKSSNWFEKASDYLNKKCGGEKNTEVLDVLEEKIIKNVEKIFERVFSYNDFLGVVEKMRKSWISIILDQDDFREIRDQMAIRGFEDCVIAWHLATEICYFAANEEGGKMRDGLYRLSNYMMYLIRKRSSMLPPGIPETQTKKTIQMCEDILRYKPPQIVLGVVGNVPIAILNPTASNSFDDPHDHLYEIMSQPPDRMPDDVRHYLDVSLDQSPFPLAALIVNRLKRFAETPGQERQWEVILDAWMEMLTYAAIHCNRSEHVRHLNAGGELLTFYWLLLAHYGVVDDYNKSSKFWYYTTIRENDVKM